MLYQEVRLNIEKSVFINNILGFYRIAERWKSTVPQHSILFKKPHMWIFRHTATKLQNPKDKKRILGTTKEERQTIYKELTIRSLISQNRDKKKINSYYQNMGN